MVHWWASWALIAILWGCGCGHATGGGPPQQDDRPQDATPSHPLNGPRSPAATQSPAAAHSVSEADPPAQVGPPANAPKERGRMVLDLAKHVERAELRQNGVLVLDAGTPAGRKYDFGGWLSGASATATFGATTALLAQNKRLRLSFARERVGAARVLARMRCFSPCKLTTYVNGKTVGHARLAGKTFEVFEVGVPADTLSPGENELLLRVDKSGVAPGLGRQSIALDWVRIGEPALAIPDDAPPTPAELTIDEQSTALRIPSDYALGYALQVPVGARLRGLVSGEAPGQLRVQAITDGQAHVSLLDINVGPQQQKVDVDLGRFAGRVARIDLGAVGADLQLKAPRIVSTARPRGLATTKVRSGTPLARNLVIILIDTLRADKLAPYNDGTRVRTPGLDRFVQHAAVLTNARAQENWTKPSVATLLSSLLPWEHNATKDAARVPAAVKLLPELLRERGYFTGSFIANGYVSDKFGFKQGWHTYRNYIREGRRAKAQYVAADVLEWLDRRPKDKPFFLYMHTIDPHVPYKPPQHFLSMYDDDKKYRGPVDFRASSTLLEKIKLGSIKLKPRDKARLEALYDAEISYHDVHFAAVIEGLEKRALAEDTIVVVTADHGEEFWDHGSVGHGHSVYDELLHVPLVMRIPGLTHGAMRADEAVGLVDVVPTVLEAMGQPVPEELSGRSLLPILRGQEGGAPRVAVAGFMRAWRTASVGKFKLIQRTLKHSWLYDTEADPKEQNDLAQSHPLALRYMRGLLGLSLADTHAAAPGRGGRKGRQRHKQQNVHIDKRTAAQLEALGYIVE